MPKQIACQNGGVFQHVPDCGDLGSAMAGYFKVLAAGTSKIQPGKLVPRQQIESGTVTRPPPRLQTTWLMSHPIGEERGRRGGAQNCLPQFWRVFVRFVSGGEQNSPSSPYSSVFFLKRAQLYTLAVTNV